MNNTSPPQLTQSRLKEIYDYNPLTGVFTKLVSSGGYKVGHIPTCVNKVGYITISVDRRRYTAHRLAWLYMEGYFPENDIDHISKNKLDNRWCNLREVSRSCNMRNISTTRANSSGVKGVYRDKRRGKWIAGIKNNYVSCSKSDIEEFIEAVAYRLAFEQAYNWYVCDEDSPAFLYMHKYLEVIKQ